MRMLALGGKGVVEFNAIAGVIRYDGFWLLDREEVRTWLHVSRVA